MYPRLIVVALIALVAIVLGGCSHRSVSSGSPGEPNLFPNTVGSSWVYVLYDSDDDSVATMTVEITDTVTLPSGKSAAIWVYSCSTEVDTDYVCIVGDTVRATGGSPSFGSLRVIERVLVIPFVVGKAWSGVWVNDTVIVSTDTSVTTPAGNFTVAFLVERQWGGLNSYGHHQSWFAPGVGLVKKIRQETGWYFYGTETWELVAFEIAP